MECIIIHYSEIALKGQNRRYFEKKLARNIKDALPEGADVKRVFGRLVTRLPEGYDINYVVSALSKTAGISNFSFATECGKDYESLKAVTLPFLRGKAEGKTFKVVASAHGFPLSSSEIEKQLGAAVVEEYKLKANMKSPDVTVHVESFDGTAYIFLEKHAGLGGLPVGSSGRIITLMSGGIDSPVAAFMVAKRGCRPMFVHFHALRSNEEAKKSKIEEIVKVLLPYLLRTKVYYIPYSLFQIATAHIPPEYELIVFRRFMNRIAEAIAEREKAKALATGESIAQVASQTLGNLRASEAVTQLPVIRPLAAFSKEEIIAAAKELGTYELSIADYKDCCSIISTHPKTNPSIEKIQKYEESVDMKKLVEDTLKESAVVAYKYGKGNAESKDVGMPELIE